MERTEIDLGTNCVMGGLKDNIWCGKLKMFDKISQIKFNKAKDAQDRFIASFCDIIQSNEENSNVSDVENHINAFLSITESVWKSRNDENPVYPFEQFGKNVNTIVDIGTFSDNRNTKIMVLKILESIYDRIAHCIYDEGIIETRNPKKKSVILFNTWDFFSLISELDINTLEKTINVSTLLYNVNLVDMALYYDEKDKSVSTSFDSSVNPGSSMSNVEVKDRIGHDQEYNNLLDHWVSTATVIDIQALLGQYILEQKRKGNLPKLSYWCREFSGWRYAELANCIDDNIKQYFVSAVANAGAMYVCGLISEGCFDIVEEGFYNQRVATFSLSNSIDRRVVVVVHAFLYYILYWEDEKYIGADLKKGCLEFWNEVADKYINYIENFRDDISNLLIEDLNDEWHFIKRIDGKEDRIPDYQSQWIYYLLRRFDYRMRNRRTGGVLVLPDAVEDFCLYTTVFLRRRGFYGSPIVWMADDKHRVESFINYISRENKKSVKKRVHEFVEFMLPNLEYKTGDGKIEHNVLFKNLYESIQVGISSLYKDEKIKEAREKEAAYLNHLDEIKGKTSGWKTSLIDAIRSAFEEDIDILGRNVPGVQYNMVQLYQYTTHTDMVTDVINHDMSQRIVTSLINNYIIMLVRNQCIDRLNKKDFKDDQDYIHYLNDNHIALMMGSEYLLKNSDYMMSEKFQKATESYKWITGIGCFYSMGAKKESVRFYLRDLDISIRNSDINNEQIHIQGVENNPDAYLYEPINGVYMKFEQKEELNDYLSKSRKIVDVTARIGFKTYGDVPIGFYFENERIPIKEDKMIE